MADELENFRRDVCMLASAYISGKNFDVSELPNVISTISEALKGVTLAPKVEQALEPAVPVKKSITPEYLICLEDGKKMKMLKRHLKTAYGMTPEDYRTRWGLPDDYPMTAPNYSEKRSKIAGDIGLGKNKEP